MPVKIIVVDNSPGYEDVRYIQEHYPEIHIIKTDDNLGFGKANNLGMRYALDHGCDYVFLLNQDAWIQKDTIEKLVDAAEKYPEYGIIGPVQCTKGLDKVLDGVIQFLINPDNVNKELFSDLILGIAKDIYPVSEINAAAWLLPRKTLETVGGFDPIFLHYSEDWNYLCRVLYHGLKVGLMPKVHVIHDCSERVKQEKGFSMSFDKWLLQRAADILYPDDNVERMMRKYKRTALLKLLTGHKKSFLENYNAYRYLTKYQIKIENSRERNKLIGPTWL